MRARLQDREGIAARDAQVCMRYGNRRQRWDAQLDMSLID